MVGTSELPAATDLGIVHCKDGGIFSESENFGIYNEQMFLEAVMKEISVPFRNGLLHEARSRDVERSASSAERQRKKEALKAPIIPGPYEIFLFFNFFHFLGFYTMFHATHHLYRVPLHIKLMTVRGEQHLPTKKENQKLRKLRQKKFQN